MSDLIDSSARIHPKAELASDVSIGPWSIIGPNVQIDSGCHIGSNVIIRANTKLGKNNKVYQFASIGEDPQDKKYHEEQTYLEIGDNNIIRESSTFHRGTVQDNGITKVGSHNLFMINSHVAHDCTVGNHTVFANNATLAGHVTVHDHAILGGFVGVHQFCHIGEYAFACMGAMINKDVPPFIRVSGYYAVPHGLNTVGLTRNDFTKDEQRALREAYKIIYRKNYSTQEAIIELEKLAVKYNPVNLFIDFLKNATRGIVR